MTDVALIREDTLDVLVFEGAMDLEVEHPGAVTDHAIPSRETVSDHIMKLPRTARFSAIVAPAPGRPDLVGGPSRIQAVIDWLEEAQTQGHAVTLQRPGQPALRLMAVESFRERSSDTDSLELEVSLKGLRLQSSRTVQLGVRAAKRPPEERRPAQEDPERVGNRPSREAVLYTLGNEIVDLASGAGLTAGLL